MSEPQRLVYHFRTSETGPRIIACGSHAPEATDNPSAVTCRNCRRTQVWWAAEKKRRDDDRPPS